MNGIRLNKSEKKAILRKHNNIYLIKCHQIKSDIECQNKQNNDKLFDINFL